MTSALCILAWAAIAGAADPVKSKPLADLYGDPLPDGAIARMGTIRAHHAGLSHYQFLADGKTIVTAGNDGLVRYWDSATGNELRHLKLEGATRPSRGALSRFGKTLAALEGGWLSLWNAETGKQIKKFPAPKQTIEVFYFSPDGQTLAIGHADWRYTFVDWKSGKEREIKLALRPALAREISGDSSRHSSFSNDGKWFLAGASWQEPLALFDAATGREMWRTECKAFTSTISPDGKRIAVSSFQQNQGKQQSAIVFLDAATGKEQARFPIANNFFSLAFSPDGTQLACGFSDNSCVLDCATGKILHQLADRPIMLDYSPDGKMLVGSAGNYLRFWDAATGKERGRRAGEFGWTPVLEVSPDGRRLASADWMLRKVSIWETATGRLLRELPLKGDGRYVSGLAWSADAITLVAGQYRGTIQFWNADSGQEQRVVEINDPANPSLRATKLYAIHVSSDGKQASALVPMEISGRAPVMAIWDTAANLVVCRNPLPRNPRQWCAWSTDGTSIALVSNGELSLIGRSTGAIRVVGHGELKQPLAASPDGRLLATGRAGNPADENQVNSCCVFETVSGREVATVDTGGIDFIRLAGNNRFLVTSDDEFLRLWDLATGKERCRWPLPIKGRDAWGKSIVSQLQLAPDGSRAFTALLDGTCLVWDLSGAMKPPKDSGAALTGEQLTGWWNDLANPAAAKGYAAIWQMLEAPCEPILKFLREHLKPAADADFDHIRTLVKDLDRDKFAVREKAYKKLENLGAAAIPALRKLLEQNQTAETRRRMMALVSRSPDLTRQPDALRQMRAIQVLERIGSAEARKLLAELAAGSSLAEETSEAKLALERLSRRNR